jgi:hypothetical protein
MPQAKQADLTEDGQEGSGRDQRAEEVSQLSVKSIGTQKLSLSGLQYY